MSIQGELAISLTHNADGLESAIISSRPMHATQLFEGKTIEQTLQMIPLLFNICANAQAVTAVRAIESALLLPTNKAIESQRDVLVTIESLREQSLQVFMRWPNFIGEPLDNEALSDIVQSLNTLIQSFEPTQILRCGTDIAHSISHDQQALWTHCKAQLDAFIYGVNSEDWLQNSAEDITQWAQAHQTQAARFVDWLNQQSWKHAGHSAIKPLPEIADSDLANRMKGEQQQFTAQPDWQQQCYEASWFNYQHTHPAIRLLLNSVGNGIYTRTVARLIEIATLMNKLQKVFLSEALLIKPVSLVAGLASTSAARGRLSHYVVLEGQQIKCFYILAPTEWNFHPEGVAADGLRHLQENDVSSLQLQADLLIHAIDPCVGYQLQINKGVMH